MNYMHSITHDDRGLVCNVSKVYYGGYEFNAPITTQELQSQLMVKVVREVWKDCDRYE